MASSYTYYASHSIAEITFAQFAKFAFRAVVKTPSTLPTSTGSTNAIFKAGLVSNLGTASITDGVYFNFQPSLSANWQLLCSKASTQNNITTGVTVAASTWYDLQIYWDANGIQARCGVWSSTLQPALVSGGPFTTDVPLTSTVMFWQILNLNGSSGTTSFALFVDLVEACGEHTDLGQLRGDQLVTSF